jgi:hypothetical protein
MSKDHQPNIKVICEEKGEAIVETEYKLTTDELNSKETPLMTHQMATN